MCTISRVTGSVGGILPGVGKGMNIIIKQVRRLVDGEIVLCQFVYVDVF